MKNVVIVGPGGLGGTVAALLARKEACRTSVIGRPGAHIDAIRSHGLRIEGRESFTARIEAVEDARDIEDCDALLFAVKAQHMQAALAGTRHIQVGEFVASLQNGVLKDDLLADVFSEAKVLGALAVVAGQCTQPGVVNWTFDGGTQFGELNGTPSARAEWIVDLFQQSGLTAQSSDAILSAVWSKMIGWVPLGLLAALSGRSNAEVFSGRQTATEYVGMVRELSALAASKGIPLIDIGPYHVRTWSDGDFAHAVRQVMTSPLTESQTVHSALQDIQRGSTTEFRAFVGPMIDEANAGSIPMQTIAATYADLMELEQTL
ncbi:MAG: hypothetical protein CMJ18_08950 [Phycisphaeraceae bacterium]|nr:hypothetical protein [Phycisphaeraceae bacterium]